MMTTLFKRLLKLLEVERLVHSTYNRRNISFAYWKIQLINPFFHFLNFFFSCYLKPRIPLVFLKRTSVSISQLDYSVSY